MGPQALGRMGRPGWDQHPTLGDAMFPLCANASLRPCAYCILNSTVTVMMTCTGSPFSRVGVKTH
jgi:hypothetical protein